MTGLDCTDSESHNRTTVRTNSLVMWSNPYLPNQVIQRPNNAIKLGNHKISKSHTKLHAYKNSYCFSTHTFTSEATAPQSLSPSHYQDCTWPYCHQFTLTACAVAMHHAFRAGDPMSNITVKNTVGKTWASDSCRLAFYTVQHTVLFWWFRGKYYLHLQSDWKGSEWWKNKYWLYAWVWQNLANHNYGRKREVRPCP